MLFQISSPIIHPKAHAGVRNHHRAVSTPRTHTLACVRVRENPHTGPLRERLPGERRNERASMCESERERGTSAMGDSPRPSELGTGPTPLSSDPPASLPSPLTPLSSPLPLPSLPAPLAARHRRCRRCHCTVMCSCVCGAMYRTDPWTGTCVLPCACVNATMQCNPSECLPFSPRLVFYLGSAPSPELGQS